MLKSAAKQNNEKELYRVLQLSNTGNILNGHGDELSRQLESRLFADKARSNRNKPQSDLRIDKAVRRIEKKVKCTSMQTTSTQAVALAEI